MVVEEEEKEKEEEEEQEQEEEEEEEASAGVSSSHSLLGRYSIARREHISSYSSATVALPVLYSRTTVLYCTVQYSTVVLYCTVLYSTVQYPRTGTVYCTRLPGLARNNLFFTNTSWAPLYIAKFMLHWEDIKYPSEHTMPKNVRTILY